LRGHLDETTTSFIVRPADRLATGLDRRTVPPRRLDDPARRTPGPPGVFISYSRRDQTYVDELVTHLRRAGVPVWVDRSGAVVPAPASALDAEAAGIGAGVVVVLTGGAVLAWLWWVVRRAAAARNAATWEREWARVGPVWRRDAGR